MNKKINISLTFRQARSLLWVLSKYGQDGCLYKIVEKSIKSKRKGLDRHHERKVKNGR